LNAISIKLDNATLFACRLGQLITKHAIVTCGELYACEEGGGEVSEEGEDEERQVEREAGRKRYRHTHTHKHTYKCTF